MENNEVKSILTDEQKIETCLMLLKDGIEGANSSLNRVERHIEFRDDLKDFNPESSKKFDDMIKKDVEFAKMFLKNLDKSIEIIRKITLSNSNEEADNTKDSENDSGN